MRPIRTTISLPTGSAPIGISFQYFGSTYTQDYVVNSGLKTLNCPGTGSVSAILQPTDQVAATVCVGTNPVFAWIYYDQSKVFVLDYSEDQVYVVNATTYQVDAIVSRLAPGRSRLAQSNNGQYVYVLNGDGTISIIDGLAEAVVETVQLWRDRARARSALRRRSTLRWTRISTTPRPIRRSTMCGFCMPTGR